jgi:hypothetical protein
LFQKLFPFVFLCNKKCTSVTQQNSTRSKQIGVEKDFMIFAKKNDFKAIFGSQF